MIFLYILLGVLGFVLLLLTIAAFTPVKIEVLYKREGSNDRGEVVVKGLAGLFTYRLEIPSIDLKLNKVDVKAKQKVGPKQDKEQVDVTTGLVQRIVNSFQRIVERVPNYYKTLNWFLSKITCEHFEWRTRFGTGEAAETGMLTAVAWTLKSLVLGIGSRYICWKVYPRVEVAPLFAQSSFDMHFHSIFRFRLGYAMLSLKLFLVDS